jgi:membrane protein YqaA with SNARE-associated domain
VKARLMKNPFKSFIAFILTRSVYYQISIALFIATFADAAILPLPVNSVFIFLCLLNSNKVRQFVIICFSGSAAGAIAGYLIGHFAWLDLHGNYTVIANFLFSTIPGFSEIIYNRIHLLYVKWDLWVLVVAPWTPVPLNVISISSGVFDINSLKFIIVLMLSTGIKFFIIGMSTVKFGSKYLSRIIRKLKPDYCQDNVTITLRQ